MNTTIVAEKLNMPVATVKRESLRSFLERKLLETKSEIFALANKYNIKSIKEFDALIKKGEISETPETREDFFKIDALEAQKDRLTNLISTGRENI